MPLTPTRLNACDPGWGFVRPSVALPACLGMAGLFVTAGPDATRRAEWSCSASTFTIGQQLLLRPTKMRGSVGWGGGMVQQWGGSLKEQPHVKSCIAAVEFWHGIYS